MTSSRHPESLGDVLAATLRRWRDQGARVRPPPGEAALTRFGTRHGVRLPDDMRAYFAVCDGMEDYDSDDQMWSFWSLDRIEAERAKEEPEVRRKRSRSSTRSVPGPTPFGFCDWCICCDVFAIELLPEAGKGNRVLNLEFPNLNVLPSFESFLRFYLRVKRMTR